MKTLNIVLTFHDCREECTGFFVSYMCASFMDVDAFVFFVLLFPHCLSLYCCTLLSCAVILACSNIMMHVTSALDQKCDYFSVPSLFSLLVLFIGPFLQTFTTSGIMNRQSRGEFFRFKARMKTVILSTRNP